MTSRRTRSDAPTLVRSAHLAPFSPDGARTLGAQLPAEATGRTVLTVELDGDALVPLHRVALTDKGGRAKDGALTVRRGRGR